MDANFFFDKVDKYYPHLIKGSVVQLLETTYLFANTYNVDIVVGRYELFMNCGNLLKKYFNNSRYSSDITLGFDLYKETYYDKPVYDFQIQMISQIENVNLLKSYVGCLYDTCERSVAKHFQEVQRLSRKDAQNKRYEKIKKDVMLAVKQLFEIYKEEPDFESQIAVYKDLPEKVRKKFET